MICIDAGHGGLQDSGAVAGGVKEKDLALTYALALGGELCRIGVPVIYTRTDDSYPMLAGRAAYANERGARGFVSVHFNASSNANAAGIWVLHAAGAPAGQRLADAISRELGGKVYPDASGWTNGRRLTVLRQTKMAAALLEYGFLTNAAERARLVTAERMTELVSRTARGIAAWLT